MQNITSAFTTPCIFVHRAITPVYTTWETHGAHIVDLSNENIMERSKTILREGEELYCAYSNITKEGERIISNSEGTKCIISSTLISRILQIARKHIRLTQNVYVCTFNKLVLIIRTKITHAFENVLYH